MKHHNIEKKYSYPALALFLFLAGFSCSAMSSDIKGEGFITSLDVEQKTISIDGKPFRLSPEIKIYGFREKNPEISRLKRGASVFYRATPPAHGKKGVILKLWNQKD